MCAVVGSGRGRGEAVCAAPVHHPASPHNALTSHPLPALRGTCSSVLQGIVMFPWTLPEEARIRRRLDSTVEWLRTADALLLPCKLAHQAAKAGGAAGACGSYRINVAAAEKLLSTAKDIGVSGQPCV